MKHGTPTGYTTHGCRCPDCTEAVRVYNAEWRRKTHRGLRKLSVSARAAKQHLTYLQESGYSERAIADLTGLSRSVIHRVLSGATKRVYAETNDKILGLTLTECRRAPSGRQPAECSLRLLREFLDAGYSQTWLRFQLGGYDLLATRPKGVALKVADRVQELHDKHWRENINNFRSFCDCYGVSDLQLKRQEEAKKRREYRAKKAQAC